MRVERNKTAKGVRGGSLVLFLGWALLAGWAQLPVGGGSQGKALREIDDPHTGERWLLVRNDENPGGPGRLVRIAAGGNVPDGTALRRAEVTESAAPPIIRSGDRVRLEEHTAVVDAVLEARAMTPAAAGAVFNARLTIGGKVVRAVALGPGRAAFQAETGARP